MSYEPAGPYPAGSTPQTPPNSSLAVISLISGILGLTLLPAVASLAAVIIGYMAKNEIRASAGTLSGEGMASAGLVLGWIGIALSLLGLCLLLIFFAIPFFLILFNIAVTPNWSQLLPLVSYI